jgi:hypothetical protein
LNSRCLCRAGHVHTALGLVIKHVDAAQLRVVVSGVLTSLKLGANLVTALALLNVRRFARENCLVAVGTREKKKPGGA